MSRMFLVRIWHLVFCHFLTAITMLICALSINILSVIVQLNFHLCLDLMNLNAVLYWTQAHTPLQLKVLAVIARPILLVTFIGLLACGTWIINFYPLEHSSFIVLFTQHFLWFILSQHLSVFINLFSVKWWQNTIRAN